MATNKMPQTDAEHPLDVAARVLGGRDRLAQLLGVTGAAIGNWKSRGVPLEQCTAIEFATGQVVRRQRLRPNDWKRIWPELKELGEVVEGQGA